MMERPVLLRIDVRSFPLISLNKYEAISSTRLERLLGVLPRRPVV